VIPPPAHAECVCAREDGLEGYTRPSEPQRPQVCSEETSTQLVAETRRPIPAGPGQPERLDYEYDRQGTAHLFRVFAPWAGQRPVKVTERRTASDVAQWLREGVDEQDPEAEKLGLVMDHLNTHQPASVSEAFEPAEARRLLDRLELHDTPKQGSWLKMAEPDLSVLATQGLARRLPALSLLRHEVAAWEPQRHTAECRVDWRFTTEDASIQLQRLYPSIQLC
jgi:hypothetical protein